MPCNFNKNEIKKKGWREHGPPTCNFKKQKMQKDGSATCRAPIRGHHNLMHGHVQPPTDGLQRIVTSRLVLMIVIKALGTTLITFLIVTDSRRVEVIDSFFGVPPHMSMELTTSLITPYDICMMMITN